MVDPQDMVARYKARLSAELGHEVQPLAIVSREYQQFKSESMPPHLSFYERLCNWAGAILKIKVSPAKAQAVQEAINICHLSITPEGATALAYILPLLFIVLGIILSLFLLNSLFLTVFVIFTGLAMIALFIKLPFYIANTWRMKASNQMVLCVFYVVTYMRHTSNLERAIEFASEHLSPPLALDLKKVLWDVESGRFASIKDSLDVYLESWRKWNREFIESIHLIESSLYETSEERRIGLLDKALEVILDETYEKMLHYAQNLKSPITMLHMMGIILPILGLVILPLAVSFMRNVNWWHLAVLYNIALPIIVYIMGKNILSKRPTGYGDTDIAEINPALKKYQNIITKIGRAEIQISPAIIAFIIGGLLLFIALSPVIIHYLNPAFEADIFGFELLGYRNSTQQPGVIVGPFGLGAAMLSFLFPLSLAFSVGLYYRLRSKNVMSIRDKTKKLEDEFSSALFQLGNRLGDGLPAEIAFERVAEVMSDTTSGQFFKLVTANIRRLGMGVREAIFNPRTGALIYFPSAVIQSSMKVLIESVKKGPRIAAQAIMNISRYIKEIHKVNERLKDLMADIISDMKSQITFLTPAIAGIVIGITSMIVYILGGLTGRIQGLGDPAIGGRMSGVLGMFGDGIPTYFFQLVVGVYVFQIIYILTVMSNGIENGADKLGERFALGKNLVRSTTLYCMFGLLTMLLFNLIAKVIFERAGF